VDAEKRDTLGEKVREERKLMGDWGILYRKKRGD